MHAQELHAGCRWINGPAFLSQPEEFWPQPPEDPGNDDDNLHQPYVLTNVWFESFQSTRPIFDTLSSCSFSKIRCDEATSSQITIRATIMKEMNMFATFSKKNSGS